MTPSISVVIPVYNVEAYLRECVDSVLAQTFSDFELILVDDGSSDSCGAICDEYAKTDNRILVIHQENKGVSAARNAGLDAMRGKYITFVDSDDLLHPQAFEIYIKTLFDHNADICVGSPMRFSDEEKLCFDLISSVSTRDINHREACREVCVNLNWMPVLWNKLYVSRLFANIRFPEGRYHEDEAISHVLMYSAEKVVQFQEIIYYYRSNPSSIMNQMNLKKYHDKVLAYSDRYAFLMSKKELEMAEIAKTSLELAKAKYVVLARKEHCYGNVPEEHRMLLIKALRVIRKQCSSDNYKWWISQVHPLLLRVYEYYMKLKSLF